MRVRGRDRGWSACLLLSLLVLVFPGTVAADTADPVPLLFETAVLDSATLAAAAPQAAARAAIRSRKVRARLDVLTHPDGTSRVAAGQRIGLNLFDDTIFTMSIGDIGGRGPFRLTWRGALEGVDLGQAVLAVHDGAVVGTVTMPGRVYRIGYTPAGGQVVEQIDPAALPREVDPTRVPPPAQLVTPDVVVTPPPQPGEEETTIQIDVMVLYTAAARAAAGGTAAMMAEVSLAVATANQAYENSKLAQRLRLVHAGETSISESDGSGDALDALRVDPLVKQLRDMTRADLVSLITSSQTLTSCGMAWLMTENSTAFAPFAFSLAELACATPNLTFPHELGHNMGAHHDAYVAGDDDTLFPYSHGYVDAVGKFRTVMAYPDQCPACGRVPFFSSPDISYNGRAMGTAATADNARTLAQTAETVAQFRQAVASPVTVTAEVNERGIDVGEVLQVRAGIENSGATGAADVFVGLMLPNGVVVFFTPGTGSGFAIGHLTDLKSFRPFAAGISLEDPFSVSVPILAYVRTGVEPEGGFVFFVLAVKKGEVTAGLDSEQVLGAALASFSFH